MVTATPHAHSAAARYTVWMGEQLSKFTHPLSNMKTLAVAQQLFHMHPVRLQVPGWGVHSQQPDRASPARSPAPLAPHPSGLPGVPGIRQRPCHQKRKEHVILPGHWQCADRERLQCREDCCCAVYTCTIHPQLQVLQVTWLQRPEAVGLQCVMAILCCSQLVPADCAVLCYAMLRFPTLYCAIICFVMPCNGSDMLCSVPLSYAMPSMLGCPMLCSIRDMLHYAMLCQLSCANALLCNCVVCAGKPCRTLQECRNMV